MPFVPQMTLNILSPRIATTSWLTSYKLETKQPSEQDGILGGYSD